MRAALARHDDILRTAVTANNGSVIKTTGDGLHAVFSTARSAVDAAVTAQKQLAAEAWPAIAPNRLKIRIGIHTGEAEERDGDYFGPPVNRAARLMAIGHGGQVLLSSVTARLLEAALVDNLDAELSLMDMGDVRLRGLKRLEHVYQLQTDGLQAVFPPLHTETAVSGNLPQHLTSFVGRQRERSDVTHLLAETRLLTLTGPGGTGKTRLSLEVAGDVQDNYTHGVWLVELAPLSDPGAVLTAVAGLWSLRENPMMSLAQVLTDYVRGKEMLLILDNCEHLVAACARLAADLLAAAPRLTIMASSREGLSVPGETTYHLPTLRIPGREVSEPNALYAFDSVQLFLERAQSVRPGFTLTTQNAEAVGRIVRRLDGIPLALELAAARLKLLPPEQLAERLDDRFRLLTGGSRTALPRQQTLRALIDWSYDFLDPAEQTLFRQLGVFAGGWSLEAAEAVANLESAFSPEETAGNEQSQKTRFLDVLDLLGNLVNKSLVVMDEQEGQARFRFLETIRQYAQDRLFEAGEGPVARDRHLNYFAGLVLDRLPLGASETHLSLYSAIGSPEMMGWVGRMHAEMDNVRAAVLWALQSDPERALAMATKLPLFFLFEGVAIEARQWLEEAVRAVKALEPASGEVGRLREILLLQGRLWQGNLQIGGGSHAEAVDTLQNVADRAQQLEHPMLLAMALSLQSLALVILGDPQAYDRAAEALALLEKIGKKRLQAMPLGNMAMAKMQQGDLQAAQALKERIRAIMKEESGTLVNSLQFVTLARLANQSHEYDEAEELLTLARDQFDDLGSYHFRTMAESEIGHLRRHRGDDAAAEAIYRRTIRAYEDLGHRPAVANHLETFAFITIHRAQYRHAAVLLGAAEALREQIDVDMLPDERVVYDAEVGALREAMKPDELTAAWRSGRALDLETAVNLALSGGAG